MPLSEEELRLLEQMERALVEEDPKFASTLRGTAMRRTARRRVLFAALIFAVGIAVLMTGAITKLWPIGLIGFVIMLGSATLGITAFQGQQKSGTGHPAEEADAREATKSAHPSGFGVIDGGRSGRTRKPRPADRGGFMERLEERWRRRRDENGGF